MSSQYSPRVDALLKRLGSDLTEQDFAALALACLDQAGIPLDRQTRVFKLAASALESDETPDDDHAGHAVDLEHSIIDVRHVEDWYEVTARIYGPPGHAVGLEFHVVDVSERDSYFEVTARIYGPRRGVDPATLVDAARATYDGVMTTWLGFARADGAGCALTCTGWASHEQWTDKLMYRELGCADAVALGEAILAAAVVP